MTRTPKPITRNLVPRSLGVTLLVTLVVTLFASPTVLASTLDAPTADTLQHMALDEKLAHDVYTTLGTLYDVPTFSAIAASEATHLDAIRGVMDRYDVADPTLDEGIGVFPDPTFQALYDDLVAAGSASIEAAAGVGVTIEEIDIADLQAAIDAAPTSDIARVYANLLDASESHLEAFTALEANPSALPVGTRSGSAAGPRDDAARGREAPATPHSEAVRSEAARGDAVRGASATAPRGRGN